jgi:hypothetical protein
MRRSTSPSTPAEADQHAPVAPAECQQEDPGDGHHPEPPRVRRVEGSGEDGDD